MVEPTPAPSLKGALLGETPRPHFSLQGGDSFQREENRRSVLINYSLPTQEIDNLDL